MFVKIAAIGLVTFVASFQGKGEEYRWDGLVGKFSMNSTDGDSRFPLPQTLEVAFSEGWTEISGMELPSNQIGLGYEEDPRVSLIYATETGNVMGLQVAFSVEDIESTGVPIDYDQHSYITRKTLNGEEFFTGTAYWYQDEDTNTRQIWVLKDGELTEIPMDPYNLSSSGYSRKTCVTWMGVHYYAIDADTDCNNIPPWAFLAVDGNIVSLLFQVMGAAQPGTGRNWYETLGSNVGIYSLPDAVPCVLEYFGDYGYVSFHLFFRENPLAVRCVNSCKAEFGEYQEYNASDYDVDETFTSYTGGADVCPIV